MRPSSSVWSALHGHFWLISISAAEDWSQTVKRIENTSFLENTENQSTQMISPLKDLFSWSLRNVSSSTKNDSGGNSWAPFASIAEKELLQQTFWGCVVASPLQIEQAKNLGACYLYIPGDVCRQADVLESARKSSLPLVLQRGSFLPPLDFVRALEKLQDADVLAAEGGSAFGYGLPTFDLHAMALLKSQHWAFALNLDELLGVPSLCDWAPAWNTAKKHLDEALLCAKDIGLHLGASCFVATQEQFQNLNPKIKATAPHKNFILGGKS